MCVLSRQLLSNIKHDFDPYLLSNDIDNGIWSQPESHKKIMEFNIYEDQKIYSQTSLIENALDYFNIHYYNFYHLMLIENPIFGVNISKEIALYLSEIYLNVPAIMINLEKTLEINNIFDHIESICENPKFKLKL